MVTCGKIGLPTTNPPTPEIWGLRPIEANTTHELNTPPSSLPGMPPGEFEYNSNKMRLTTSCVFHGAPAKAYIQGVLRETSFPMNANSLHGPALSCWKWRSRRATAGLLLPMAFKRPSALKPTMKLYGPSLPSL